MNTVLSVLLFAVTSCLLGPSPVPIQAQLGTPSEFFPEPKSGLSIQTGVEKPLRLSELLGEFSHATGMTIVTDEVTRRMLDSSCGLNQDVEVPPNQVYGFTESVLSYHGFQLYHLRSEAPRLLGVTHPRAQGGTSGPIKPVYVPADALERWTGHPAFLVQTVLTLPNLDVRTLSNSLRQVFDDSRAQQIVPMGNSNSVLITGSAASAANLVEMLRHADEEAARAPKPAAPVPTQVPPAQAPAPK
ncbi:MAG: hypothetical protein IPJ19_16870 [Planctomycetes bacterium]|nr:hypothetical protein [Planctomycetota bacterium]